MNSYVNYPGFIQVGVVDQLKEVGPAIVFAISSELFLCGFVIRFRGEIYAYSNRCPIGIQDWTGWKENFLMKMAGFW